MSNMDKEIVAVLVRCVSLLFAEIQAVDKDTHSKMCPVHYALEYVMDRLDKALSDKP